jgi:hypothetical protein
MYTGFKLHSQIYMHVVNRMLGCLPIKIPVVAMHDDACLKSQYSGS